MGKKDKASPSLGRSGVVVTAENFVEFGKSFCDEFIEAASVHDKWNVGELKEGVQLYRRAPSSGEGVDFMKGATSFKVDPETAWKAVVDPSHLRFVDKYYESATVKHEFDGVHRIVHYTYKMPFPVYSREFVVFECNKKVDDNTWVACTCSISGDAFVAPTKNYVRGILFASGYYIVRNPANPQQCSVTSVTQADMRGAIPKWMVNKDAAEQPLVLNRIRLLLEEGVKTFNKDEK